MQLENPVVIIFITVQESDSKQDWCWFEGLQSESFHVSYASDSFQDIGLTITITLYWLIQPFEII